MKVLELQAPVVEAPPIEPPKKRGRKPGSRTKFKQPPCGVKVALKPSGDEWVHANLIGLLVLCFTNFWKYVNILLFTKATEHMYTSSVCCLVSGLHYAIWLRAVAWHAMFLFCEMPFLATAASTFGYSNAEHFGSLAPDLSLSQLSVQFFLSTSSFTWCPFTSICT